MVLSRTDGSKDSADMMVYFSDSNSATIIVQMSRLSPYQPSKWTYGQDNSIVGYNPLHGFSAESGALSAIETEAMHVHGYINEYDLAMGGSYDWHIDLANEDFATGYQFKPSDVTDVVQADKPRMAVTNINLYGENDEFTAPMINGIYYTDTNERVYSGEDWEPTGRYDASSLPPDSDEWTLFEEGRSCSAYLMKSILSVNPNKINHATKQAWSIPL